MLWTLASSNTFLMPPRHLLVHTIYLLMYLTLVMTFCGSDGPPKDFSETGLTKFLTPSFLQNFVIFLQHNNQRILGFKVCSDRSMQLNLFPILMCKIIRTYIFIWYPKFYNHALWFVEFKTLGTFFKFWLSVTWSVQAFQPIILIYTRCNFVYHNWEYTSIYWPLS